MRSLIIIGLISSTISSAAWALQKEEHIQVSDLPEAVLNVIKSKYPQGVINAADKVVAEDGTVTEYAVDVTTSKDIELAVDSNGKVLEEDVDGD
jgi:hypothetical protein